MSVLSKAVQKAKACLDWEQVHLPQGTFREHEKLSDEQVKHRQGLLDEFQGACKEAASKLSDAASAKAAYDALTPAEYEPLFFAAARYFPIEESTEALAEAICPARLRAVKNVRSGDMLWKSEQSSGVIVHHAKERPELEGLSRQAMEKLLAQERAAEASTSFGALAQSLSGMTQEQRAEALDKAQKSLSKLGGVKMIEGEMGRVAPEGARGQLGLFGADEAPIPADAPRRRGRPRGSKTRR